MGFVSDLLDPDESAEFQRLMATSDGDGDGDGRYDQNLWIGDVSECAAYLPS